MSTELGQALERVARRFRRLRLWAVLAVCWLGWAAVGVGLYALGAGAFRGPFAGGLLPLSFALLAASTGAVATFLALRSVRDPRWVARRIEAKHPELGTGLLAALEQDDAAKAGRLGFLQTAVVREAMEHGRSNDWGESVSSRALGGLKVAHAAALGLLLVTFATLVARARSNANDAGTSPTGGSAAAVKVEPGDTELERGATLLVVARFEGAVPADSTLVVGDGKAPGSRVKMSRSLDDPTFGARVESVETDLSYRVEFAGGGSDSYAVKVFEYPELRRADAKLVFPTYTALPPKTVEDVRHVTAVEGTELTLTARLNKDVASAKLVDEKGEAVDLTLNPGSPHAYAATIKATDPRRFKLALVDREGRVNKLSADLVVNVTRNRPAVVTTTRPSHDVRVSPVEELALKARLEDDYGVVRRGLSYTLAGKEPTDVEFTGPAPTPKKIEADHLLDFEALKASPDELVTYFFWAEDVGPDNQPRRTSGDMFFAEVRHFEEIFRQGEQPPSGSAQDEQQEGQGNAQQAEKLAELQKQIINGTWTLIRRETKAKPTDTFAADSKILKESQHTAIEQAAALGEKLTDERSKLSLKQATRFMTDAETRLGEASDTTTVAPLRPALVAAQAAYQALLKLRAREFEVVRNNSRQRQGGRQSGGSPSQRQLQQLELSNDENRYEEQSKAAQQKLTQREQEQRENRQVSSRLRELAQRQNDLNNRLKELQSALEAAKTAEAREEIQRQLKRLRDQQQQILRDTDELQERTEREENRDRLADARQQIEQARENLRQASQALEDGKVPQAVTEGTRAGQQLNDLREQIRKKTSDRFSEEMTEMRDQAKALDDEQKRLSDKLASADKPTQGSLREPGEKAQARQGLEQQGKNLDKLLDRMRNTVQDAEETEPLLAKGLYDTVKKADEQRIPDALKVAEQLAEAGINDEAAEASRRAGQGIGQLREGVERAARGVLGDETAGLKRARGELDDLADQVNREIARATGRNPADSPSQGQRRNGPDPNAPADKARDGRQASADPNAQTEPQKSAQAQLSGQGKQQGRQGQQPGQGKRQGQQPGQGKQQGQPGQGKQQGQQGQDGQQGEQGQQPSQNGQQGEGNQQGEQPGQGQQGQQPGQGGQQGQQGQGGRGGRQGLRGGTGGQERQAGSPNGGGGGPGDVLDRAIEGLAAGPGGPVTGEGYRQWSDRMRDVEELLNDPELRAEAARIRDRVRGAREEFKRHAKEPDWKQFQGMVAEPIRELRDRVAEEVRRRESPDSLVPIDRDPVPPQFSEGVRRYYERLGSGR